MPTDPIERLLPAPLRAAISRSELLVRRPVAGARHGVHRSLRPGVGRDFRDYRPYVAGDDMRRLDWRAAARSQRLVVRQTESEEELDVLVVADGSGGMDYGEGEAHKWLRAGSLAAALTSLALRQGDRVGVAVGRAGEVEAAALEPAARRDRLHALAEAWARPARGDCPWEGLLDRVAPRLRGRSLVVVLSDFLDPGGQGPGTDEGGAGAESGAGAGALERSADESLLRGLTLMRAAGHDVALVQVLHRDELEFPWDRQRVIELEDPRGRRPMIEGPARRLREGYLERVHAHLRWLERSCERGGLLLSRVLSDEDPAAATLDLLARLAGAPNSAVLELGQQTGGPT